jgi:hypothetical protein
VRKQMEGDNQRRRTLARQARERGLRASEPGASLSATKQLTSLDRSRRDGPAPAGRHKPDSTRGGPTTPPPARPEPTRAAAEPAPPQREQGYRALVAEIGRRAGVDFPAARVGAEATVLALAAALRDQDRARLLAGVPLTLHAVAPVEGVPPHGEVPGFLAEVARLSGRTPEQARYQVEATLAALAEADRELVASLAVPQGLRDVLPPEITGS